MSDSSLASETVPYEQDGVTVISGDIGCGKTKLLESITRESISRDDEVQVVILTFLNEFGELIEEFDGKQVEAGQEFELNSQLTVVDLSRVSPDEAPQVAMGELSGISDKIEDSRNTLIAIDDAFTLESTRSEILEAIGYEKEDRTGVLLSFQNAETVSKSGFDISGDDSAIFLRSASGLGPFEESLSELELDFVKTARAGASEDYAEGLFVSLGDSPVSTRFVF